MTLYQAILIVKSIFGKYFQNFVGLKILIEASVGNAVTLFIKAPLVWAINISRGEASIFSWCHRMLVDLTQSILIVKNFFGEYHQNFVVLKI
jgi:hypothetical protein